MERVIGGRYDLIEEIGAGTAGTVFRARDLRLRRWVAVKVLRTADEAARARFLREARSAAGLTHRALVEVYDFGFDDDSPYLVMEFLEGRTLRQLLDERRGPLTEPLVLHVGSSIARGLAHAHDQGLVHRDVKPGNIMLSEPCDERSRVVLLDFGLAFSWTGKPELSRQTQPGALAGTPRYMAPEQARGDDVGPEADVYALGTVIYEMLTGETPFQGDLASVLTSQMYLPPVSLKSQVPAAPNIEELDRWTTAMLAKSPEERPHAAEVAAKLDQLALSIPQNRRSGAMSSSRSERMVATASATATNFGRVLIVGVAAGTNLPEGLHHHPVALDDVCDVAVIHLDDPYEFRADRFDCPVVAHIPKRLAGEAATLIRMGLDDIYWDELPAGEIAMKITRAARLGPTKRKQGGREIGSA